MVIEELKRGDAFRIVDGEEVYVYSGNVPMESFSRVEMTSFELTVKFPHGTGVEKV